eukprot:4178066-Pyramimonas_sp.AAC.1
MGRCSGPIVLRGSACRTGPPTDLRDAQCALIRRWARRALADALPVDPRVAERPSQAKGPRLTNL